MKFEGEALHLVKRKFPGQDERIEHLFSNNEHFHDLCLDYLACVENLERFIADTTERKAWMQEYGSLRKDLEDELSYFIIKHKTRGNSPVGN